MSGFAVVAVLCFLAAGKLTRERVEPDLREQSDIARDLRRIVSCAPWWLLFAISFFTIAAFTLRFGVAAYYFKYYADQQAVESWSGVRGGAISAFFTLGSVSSLVGVAAFSALAKRLDKRVGYVVLIVLSGGVSLLFAVLDPKNVTGMILTQGLFALLTGPTAAVLFAMYTDVAAYIRSRTGTVSDGLVMAAGSFAQKFGWAIGGAMTGILLGLAGYVPDQPQSEEVRGVMSFMMSWAPMICCLVGAALMAVYPLGDARMQAITAELARRDAAARG
jgi:GPH family glycoside/pentoside/hexuronide:cation symporter